MLGFRLPREMDDRALDISLRLKAARYLAGSRAASGKQKGKAIALPVRDLAERLEKSGNRIAIDRLQAFEQMRGSEARSMELEKIAAALGLPPTWFELAAGSEVTDAQTAARVLPELLAGVRALHQESELQLRDADERDR